MPRKPLNPVAGPLVRDYAADAAPLFIVHPALAHQLGIAHRPDVVLLERLPATPTPTHPGGHPRAAARANYMGPRHVIDGQFSESRGSSVSNGSHLGGGPVSNVGPIWEVSR